MTQTEHRGAGNFSRNHPQGNKPTGVDHGPKFQQQKRNLYQRVASQIKPMVELVKKAEQK
jgi:hypothetical protein